MVLFLALKHTVGLRVSADEEIAGLDVGEHGMEAYAGFQIFNNQ
jgi:Amt family ammonium transporter